MAKPRDLLTSPMTLVCPRCHAVSGQVCEVIAGSLELVHVERIAAAAEKDLEERRRLSVRQAERFLHGLEIIPESKD